MTRRLALYILFFFTAPAPSEIYSLSLHDALPISGVFHNLRVPVVRSRDDHEVHVLAVENGAVVLGGRKLFLSDLRSEEHTSELQSRFDLVCRLLLEKKNNTVSTTTRIRPRSSPHR